MQKKLIILTTLALMTGSVSARDCTQGEALYREGLAAGKSGNMSLAVEKLQQSMAQCESYESAYLLGQAYQELGQADQAQAAFEQAQRIAANDDAAAMALGRLAETRRAQGDVVEALSVIQEARAIHSSPPAWMDTLAIELDSETASQPLEVAQVTRALTLPKRAFHIVDKPPQGGNSVGGNAGGNTNNTSSAGNVAATNPYANLPSINVRINFEYNSTSLDSQSQGNLQVLADALSQSTFAGKRFVLIGHTDVRGDRAYNQRLSEQRASAVLGQIMSMQPELRGRMRAEGAGEARPLYQGNSEREHALNRRLEVVVEG